jgi:predicted dehydrogenase
MKKVLIIGFGSIGKKHAGLFQTLNAQVALVTSQVNTGIESFATLVDAIKNFKPEIVLVTNETEKHLKSLKELTKLVFKGSVYVEKPLFDKTTGHEAYSFENLRVLYNLRMSPLLIELKKYLNSETIVSVNIYCGQYLPTWRPGRDYRETYSAKKACGGGVLRDLSHELDYASWLFGDFKKISALGGHLSNLEIDSDDTFNIIGKCTKAPSVNITVNYLDRNPKRTMIINTNDKNFSLDFIKGELWKNDELILSGIKTSETYLLQAKNMLAGSVEDFCTLEHGSHILKLIEAAEISSREERFVSL